VEQEQQVEDANVMQVLEEERHELAYARWWVVTAAATTTQ